MALCYTLHLIYVRAAPYIKICPRCYNKLNNAILRPFQSVRSRASEATLALLLPSMARFTRARVRMEGPSVENSLGKRDRVTWKRLAAPSSRHRTSTRTWDLRKTLPKKGNSKKTKPRTTTIKKRVSFNF